MNDDHEEEEPEVEVTESEREVGAERREWMDCWGLLGLFLIVVMGHSFPHSLRSAPVMKSTDFGILLCSKMVPSQTQQIGMVGHYRPIETRGTNPI